MDIDEWKRTIRRNCKAVGTYSRNFESVIDALAKILSERDAVYKQYEDEGSEAMVEKISDRGAVNHVINPLLTLWKDLNTSALAYWRDLGLTPAGLKRINEEGLKKKEKGSALEEALKSIGGS